MTYLRALTDVADPFPADLTPPDMAVYTDPIHLVRFPEALAMHGRRDPDYIVARDYGVTFLTRTGSHRVTVPAGLMTDLASVPAPLRIFVGRVGRHLEAAIVHDYLYVMRWTQADGSEAAARRAWADAAMLALMRAADVPLALPIYLFVRWFGWIKTRRSPRADFADLRHPMVAEQMV